jgi:phosphohistidine phosphatase
VQLYLIRHAEAVSLGVNGIDRDEDRPLTETGRNQCLAVAVALRELGFVPEVLLTSPLARARQTADGLAAVWGDRQVSVRECEELAPEHKKRKVLREILAVGGESVGMVGHNPDLSELTAWFLGERQESINLDKAGVACIHFDSSPNKGCGTLVWLVTPAWCERIAANVS